MEAASSRSSRGPYLAQTMHELLKRKAASPHSADSTKWYTGNSLVKRAGVPRVLTFELRRSESGARLLAARPSAWRSAVGDPSGTSP
jgi:hypothetical protein